MHTEAFSLEGPELGVLASGDVELMSEGKPVDAKVAVFLYPKLDRVLGKIPILSQILLGTDSNLVAAYFQVKGPWGDPEVKSILLPASAGPTSIVLQGVPLFVKRGFKALGSLIRPEPSESEDPPADELVPPPGAESAALPASELGTPSATEPEASPPANSAAPPAAKSATPSEEPEVPSEESATPSEEPEVPSEESVAPSEESVAPSEESVAPSEESVSPSEGGS
jgi:hypothetical protein